MLRRFCFAWLVVTLGLCLGVSSSIACTNGAACKQYVNPGTVVTFADSAQTPTRTFTLSALGTGAGQYSAQHDKGAGAQPGLWQVGCHVQLTNTNVVGALIELYLVRWDASGANADGALTTSTASLATDKRRNLKFLGVLTVDQTTTNTTMSVNIDNVSIPGRYFSLAIWNGTTLNFKTDTAVHGCYAVPMPFEMQP